LSAKYAEELSNWRKSLSRFLDEGFDTSLLIPLFQRQRNVLNLAYYHALILVHRPFLLSNFASLNSRNARGAIGTPDVDRNVRDCFSAAMKIAEIVNELTEGRQIFRAFWVGHLTEVEIFETDAYYPLQSLPNILLFVQLLFYMFIRYVHVQVLVVVHRIFLHCSAFFFWRCR